MSPRRRSFQSLIFTCLCFTKPLFVVILLVHVRQQAIGGKTLFYQRMWPHPHCRLEFVRKPKEPFDQLIQSHVLYMSVDL